MKFLCDYMLVRLGRWLRAAGYDTVIAKELQSDPELILKAINDGRFFITRDRLVLQLKDAEKVTVVLHENSVDECAKELSDHLRIDWLKAPFSRCLLCNTPLISINADGVDDIPKDVKERACEFWRCLHCQKTFWEGSHTKRMRQKLSKYQNFLKS